MNKIEELLKKVEELEKENQLLQEKNKALECKVGEVTEITDKKNTLISQISHEIRTPLNVVMGMASIAKEELDNKNKVKDNLVGIENSSRLLLGIVDNILDISSLASGTFKLDSSKFDLKEQITGLGVHFYELAKYKEVHFDIHIKGVSEEYLIGDEKRIQQIMTNLFSNSLRLTPAGGKIDLTVLQASASRNRVHMRFILQDTGIGMSETVVKELFLPYEEKTAVDENTYTDTGIGLFVTKQLITMLGGAVSVESCLGEGTKITVDIPFQKTKQKNMNIEGMNRHKILVVADENIGKERGNMLADMGISYETAIDSEQALELLGEHEEVGNPFTICMIDMNMNGTYPESLVVDIKKIFGEHPIIIATSYNSKEEKYRMLGADYAIENTLFRSTIFDVLMKLEKGKLLQKNNEQDLNKNYDFSGKRILVVEDILLNMEVLVKLLSKVNTSIVCAQNGEEAVDTFCRKPAGYFDCILMDINMPIMDGYKATTEIRNSSKKDALTVPIFAMTANAFAEDIAKSLEVGMNGHIAKPIDVHLLYKTLNKLFSGYENEKMQDDLLEKAKKLEQQNTKLKQQAEHDPLTGLYNRYAYEKEIYTLMQKKEPVGFVLLDIDYFKEINDKYGHETGDQVLKNVAKVIKANVRTTDIVIRLGGDEFAIILREYGNRPQMIYKKIRKINEMLMYPTLDIPPVTMSVGAAFSDIGYTTELYGDADKALYQTKKNGRNGCTIYDDTKWSNLDEVDKKRYTVKEYMNFTLEGRENIGDLISIAGYRLLEYSLKAQLESYYGETKQQEIFREAGFNAGVYFVDTLLDTSLGLTDFIEQLVEKLKQLRIGNLVLNEMNEKTGEAILSVFEDADCSGMASIGQTVCHYDEGFIAGILSVYTKTKYTATEVECWAKGDKACKFVAVPQKKS